MTKKCPKGKACGSTCIRKTYKCRFDVNSESKVKLGKLAAMANAPYGMYQVKYLTKDYTFSHTLEGTKTLATEHIYHDQTGRNMKFSDSTIKRLSKNPDLMKDMEV